MLLPPGFCLEFRSSQPNKQLQLHDEAPKAHLLRQATFQREALSQPGSIRCQICERNRSF